jgi:hypothetical protein
MGYNYNAADGQFEIESGFVPLPKPTNVAESVMQTINQRVEP